MMGKSIAGIAALLIATAILISGNGLQGTLLPVRANLEAFPTSLIGAMMSGYFVGFILGCRIIPTLIQRVGHIRVFLALASIASASTLLHVLFVNVWVWALLRAVTGFCFAGLSMVLESWINERVTNENRGRVLSVYRMVDLGALTLGNLLLGIANPEGFALFALVSILVSLALVPVALTRTEAPAPLASARLDLPRLYRLSPVAVFGALATGLANAAFWSLAPVFIQETGRSTGEVATFMSITVLGAALSTWPIGLLSDKIDRRIVLALTSAVGAGAALMVMGVAGGANLQLYGTAFVWGAMIIPTMGLAIAHANDHAEKGTSVATNGGLLMLHGLGAIIGANAGGQIITAFGAPSLFAYIAAIYGVLSLVCIIRIASRKAVATEDKSAFTPIARNATPAAFEGTAQTGEHAATPTAQPERL